MLDDGQLVIRRKNASQDCQLCHPFLAFEVDLCKIVANQRHHRLLSRYKRQIDVVVLMFDWHLHTAVGIDVLVFLSPQGNSIGGIASHASVVQGLPLLARQARDILEPAIVDCPFENLVSNIYPFIDISVCKVFQRIRLRSGVGADILIAASL